MEPLIDYLVLVIPLELMEPITVIGHTRVTRNGVKSMKIFSTELEWMHFFNYIVQFRLFPLFDTLYQTRLRDKPLFVTNEDMFFGSHRFLSSFEHLKQADLIQEPNESMTV